MLLKLIISNSLNVSDGLIKSLKSFPIYFEKSGDILTLNSLSWDSFLWRQ
jgi:hypothetical protein